MTNRLPIADVRALLRRPRSTALLVLTLGLGIAAVATAFSVLDAIVLRPLPYPNSERLVLLTGTHRERGLYHEGMSPVDLQDYMGLGHLFRGIAGWWRPDLNLTDEFGEPVRLGIVDVTDGFFAVLGVRPAAGRFFAPDEDRAGSERLAVISHRLWRGRYGGIPNVVGRRIRLDGESFTILGVAPPGFEFPAETDLWRPLGWDLASHSRQARFMEVVARLEDGVEGETAQREVSALAERLAREHPATNAGWGVRVVPLREDLVGGFRSGVWLLFAATLVLLLIACVNVATVLLMQATVRERDLAIRAALGAGCRQLVWHQMSQSLLQGLLGGALGMALTVAAVEWLARIRPFELPLVERLAVDPRVVLFAFTVSVAASLLFGVAPARRAARIDIARLAKEGAGTGGRGGRRSRRLLIVCEVMLASFLAIQAGLLVRSFIRISEVEPGIDPERVLSANVQLPIAGYRQWPAVEQFYRELLVRLEARPEILEVSATSHLPLEASWRIPVLPADRPRPRPGEESTTQFRIVGPGFFELLGIPVLEGRTFTEADDARVAGVAVISQSARTLLWPDRDAVGAVISTPVSSLGPVAQSLIQESRYWVIGVVGDVKSDSLLEPAEPTVYFSFHQFPHRSLHLLCRGAAEPAILADGTRGALADLDRNLALAEVRPLEEVLADDVANRRLSMLVVSAFALLALVLAGIGVFGVLSYNVAHRRREIGIRMALGARGRDIRAMVGAEGLSLVLYGLLIGAFLAVLTSRSIAHFLYGISATDWPTFAGVAVTVLVTAAAASWLPAARAAAVDPASSIRSR